MLITVGSSALFHFKPFISTMKTHSSIAVMQLAGKSLEITPVICTLQAHNSEIFPFDPDNLAGPWHFNLSTHTSPYVW